MRLPVYAHDVRERLEVLQVRADAWEIGVGDERLQVRRKPISVQIAEGLFLFCLVRNYCGVDLLVKGRQASLSNTNPKGHRYPSQLGEAVLQVAGTGKAVLGKIEKPRGDVGLRDRQRHPAKY